VKQYWEREKYYGALAVFPILKLGQGAHPKKDYEEELIRGECPRKKEANVEPGGLGE